MFPAFEFNQTWVDTHCLNKYGVTPAHSWISSSYGGWDAITGNGVSNIVFSNGEYDPWRAAGVYGFNATERDVVSLLVQQGAHHLDLMFSTEDDPQSVRDVGARGRAVLHLQVGSRICYTCAHISSGRGPCRGPAASPVAGRNRELLEGVAYCWYPGRSVRLISTRKGEGTGPGGHGRGWAPREAHVVSQVDEPRP